MKRIVVSILLVLSLLLVACGTPADTGAVDQVAELEAQIAELQAELEAAQDNTTVAELEEQIADLQAQLEAAAEEPEEEEAPAEEPEAAEAPVAAETIPCDDLADLELPEVSIIEVEDVNPNAAVRQGTKWESPESAFGQASVGVPFCRVAASAAPSITFEVWMPPADAWNGKLNGVGNGALAGGINYGAMVDPLTKGYATTSTDGGHQSPAPVLGDWMAGRPDLWVDFGYRAIHVMTVNAKAIIEAYYGTAPEYSYFTGCSGGGQQGLAEVQRFPADYDGVVSGAPANYPTRMWPGETYAGWVAYKYGTQLSLGGEPGPPAPTPKLITLNNAVIAACDANDGVEDGIVSDPTQCDFDPATLLCEGEDSDECLTQAEVDTVKAIYAGLIDPTTGEQFWPGYELGSELEWAGHIYPFIIPLGYFQNVLFADPEWDYQTFDFTDPADFARLLDGDARYGPIFNAIDPDLTAFKELGGRLILWHGWYDQNIAPRNSINYYNNVVTALGGEAEAQEVIRLFMVPGMGHCSGGPGPDNFDALAALEMWVEQGVAPESIEGAHMTEAGEVDLSRPLCLYPQVAVYNSGSGDITDAANFTCAVP